MKKAGFFIVLLIVAAAGLSAQVKVRISGIADWNNERDVANMGGVQFEILGENLGFGLEALAGSLHDEEEPYSISWQGQLFVSYHLFGGDCFLDPYLQAGYGNGGQVFWTEAGREDLQLSLFPSFSAGANIVFDEGLILGLRHSYRPDNDNIPGTDIDVFDLDKNQFTLQVGVQLGGREYREKRSRHWHWCECDCCD